MLCGQAVRAIADWEFYLGKTTEIVLGDFFLDYTVMIVNHVTLGEEQSIGQRYVGQQFVLLGYIIQNLWLRSPEKINIRLV